MNLAMSGEYCILGGAIASLLGFVVFYLFVNKKKKKKKSNRANLVQPQSGECDKNYSEHSGYRSGNAGNIDIIIVDAGVAGSALACTLAKLVASTINTLAAAFYKVFCASPNQARNELREACFDYLSLGGVFSNGLVALLSGLNPRPLSSVLHFFSVAIYGVGQLLLPFPSRKRAWLGTRLILDASSIIFSIIKAEGVRQMFFSVAIPQYYRSSSIY